MSSGSTELEVPQEMTVRAAGLDHALRVWGRPGARPILALHGWLDSAGTWDRFAPLLVRERDVQVLAVDFAGHGRSEHRGLDAWYGFADFLYATLALLDALGWDDCTLLGHSMGAVVSALTAGVAPERFRAVALVEGIAPMTTTADEALDQMRKGVASVKKYSSYGERVLPDFETVCARIAARPWRLTPEAVEALARRGAREVDGGWAFTHDPRLKAESLVRMTPEQVLAFLRGITAPTLLVVADDGIPYPEDLARKYVRAVEGIRVVRVPGRHHIHLDSPEVVLPHVIELLDHTAP